MPQCTVAGVTKKMVQMAVDCEWETWNAGLSSDTPFARRNTTIWQSCLQCNTCLLEEKTWTLNVK